MCPRLHLHRRFLQNPFKKGYFCISETNHIFEIACLSYTLLKNFLWEFVPIVRIPCFDKLKICVGSYYTYYLKYFQACESKRNRTLTLQLSNI